MTTNPYVSNYTHTGQQGLIEDLIIESIQFYGIDVYYLPRTGLANDDLLNEDDISSYDSAYTVEMYIKNIDGFQGEGDFLSKFGLQIRDSMTMTVARRRFNETVAANTSQAYPREGDLLYFPLNDKVFQISHVEHEAVFYAMGALQTYDLKSELFEYSNEIFNTGIPTIDAKFAAISTDGQATLDSVDPIADNSEIDAEGTDYLDFTDINLFGDKEY